MYLIISLILFLSGFETAAKAPVATNTYANSSAEDVLKTMSEKLNNLISIQYKHRRELNYPSTFFFNELTGNVFMDFTSEDTVIGTRYYFEGSGLILAFNGSESFICNSGTNTININRTPKVNDIQDISFLNHSILSLKRALPWLIADKSIPKQIRDTLINGKPFYQVFFTLKNEIVGTLGERWHLTNNIDIKYRVLVDKKNYFPVGIYQTNNVNKDFLETSFTDIKVNKSIENEAMLFYSFYLNRYKEESTNNINPLIKIGALASNWQLNSLNSEKPVSLSELKGNVVLLNFWICHCGYCIADIKDLNLLHNKYKNKNFRLLAINAYDPPETLKNFMNKMQPVDYEVLSQGENVRLKYGIKGFPTLILLDKKGIVIYTGTCDRKKIEYLIDINL